MKLRSKHRFVFFLCILILGEEFARARTVYEQLDHYKLPFDQEFDEESDEEFEREDNDDDSNDDDNGSTSGSGAFDGSSKRMDLVKKKPVDVCGGEKRWVSGLFKAVGVVTKIVSYTSIAVTLAANIYSAVRGCKDIEPKAEEFHNMYKDEIEVAKQLGAVADDLQFEAVKDQNFIDGTVELYRKILCKLNEIDEDSGTMLMSMSPKVRIASKNASDEIQLLVEEKNKTLESITYIEIDDLYRSKLQHALGIALPALMLGLPLGWSLFKTARKRYRQRKVGVAEAANNLDLELPAKSKFPKLFTKTRFGRWIGRVQQNFGSKISSLKTKFNTYFGKVGKIATRFTKLLGSAFTIVAAAYGAYKAIDSLFGECRKIRETAESAYNQAKDAVTQINQTLSDIREHRQEMGKAWGFMRGNLTQEEFLESVKETKTTMENAANQSEPMKAVARKIGDFLSVIKTSENHNTTYDASLSLYNAIIHVPFAYICYTNKINIITNVASYCKDGALTLDQIIPQQRAIFTESAPESDASSPKRCKDDLGIDYLPDESIKTSWLATAKENGYHPICYMNDKDTRETICDKYRSQNWSASKIANEYDKDENKVQEIIDLLPVGLSASEQKMACNIIKRKGDTPETRQEIHTTFNNLLGLKRTMEQINAVECNEEGTYHCVPFEKTVENAFKEMPIEIPEVPEED